MATIFGLLVVLGFGALMLYQAYEIPAEPVLFVTAPTDYGLSLEPSNPKPIVGVFLIACHNGTFVCADNGAAFHHCTKSELDSAGLTDPTFSSGKCLAGKTTTGREP